VLTFALSRITKRELTAEDLEDSGSLDRGPRLFSSISLIRLMKSRQSPYNRGKSTQTAFYISIKPCFRLRRSYLKARENNKGKMIRTWVELEKDRYEPLKELEENTGKGVSRMIREAASRSVEKKELLAATHSRGHQPVTLIEEML